MLTVSEITEFLARRYPSRLAESWDRNGLVCGDPAAPARRVLLVVDVTQATVAEAIEREVDVIIAHHPLLLRGVHSVATTHPKGALLHQLIRAGVALYTAHTTADSAVDGVSDALARALRLTEIQPLVPKPVAEAKDHIYVYVPEVDGAVDQVIDAIDGASGAVWGEYSRCAWTVTGTGTFTPGPNAKPTIGTPGERAIVAEARIDMTIPRTRRDAVIAAMRAAHPYEVPAFGLVELAEDRPSPEGLGRIGRLPAPVSLAEFTTEVAAALPETTAGIRAAGDPGRVVKRVAVCGGAGDSLVSAAASAGVEAFVTADLRHHVVAEAIDAGGPALIDAGHWATEWLWLPQVSQHLTEEFGATVEAIVSTVRTDPWTIYCAKKAG